MKLSFPSFEGGFYKHHNRGNMLVANGWQYHDFGSHAHPFRDNGEYKEPELQPEVVDIGRGRVHSGEYGQKGHNTFSISRFFIFQEMPVLTGNWYEFAAWLYVWTSKDDNPDVSAGSRYHARSIANPWGAKDAHTMVFGREAERRHYNQWYHASVVFQAWASKVLVGVEGMAEFAVKHNDLYIDDATFREVWVVDSDAPPQPVLHATGDYAEVLQKLNSIEQRLLMPGWRVVGADE